MHTRKEIRDLSIDFLKSDNGINKDTWKMLKEILIDVKSCHDIIDSVRILDNKVYLPADFGCR
jgi:hypothetical protein